MRRGSEREARDGVLPPARDVRAEAGHGREAGPRERFEQPPVARTEARRHSRAGGERLIEPRVELIDRVALRRRRHVVLERRAAVRRRVQGRNRVTDGAQVVRRHLIAWKRLPREWIHRRPEERVREVPFALGKRRHVCDARDPFTQPRAFVIEKEERAVADDRAAERSAELMAPVVGRRLAGGREVIARVERAIAQELVRRSAGAVGAGPGDDVDLGAGVPAVRRIVGGRQHAEFADAIDGRADGGRVQLRIDVVHAVEQEGIEVLAAAVRRECEVAPL